MSHRALVTLSRWWPWVLAVLVLWPLLAPGHVLSYDMVFVPDLAMRPDFLGLGSGLPRAVPSDAVVAVLDELLPGQVVQKAALFGALVVAGHGARRLAPEGDPFAGLAATTFYVWTPLVAERLVIGHWPLLLTYAALPWLHLAVRRVRRGEGGLPTVALWLVLAGLSAAGGVLSAAFALLGVVGRGPAAVRRTLAVAAVAVAANAPWLVAGALHGGAALSDPDAVGVFASRGEGGLPVWLTVLGLGGVWNAEVVPTSRTGWPTAASLVLLLALAAAGAVRLRTREAGWLREHGGLVAAAVLGVVVALAGNVAPGAMGWLVAHVPGGGVLRDGSRALVLLAPLLVMLVAHGARAAVETVADRRARAALGTVLLLAPVALMPDLANGVGGRLVPVAFPEEYAEAREALAGRVGSQGGDLLVLPFSTYRLPDWNGSRRTLDPLGRFMTPDYLASDTLVVSGRTIEGEDLRARRVHRLLEDAASATGPGEAEVVSRLADEGVRWVLVDRFAEEQLAGQQREGRREGRREDRRVDRVPSVELETQPVVHEGERLVVWELDAPVSDGADDPWRTGAVGLAWLVWLGTVLGAAARGVLRLRSGARYQDHPRGPRRGS